MFRSLLICLLLFTYSVLAAEELEALIKAAEQGDAQAQYDLGVMYDSGQGIPEDDVQAYAWLNVAAAQGFDSAQKVKERIAKNMTGDEIAEAQKLSREYLEAYVSNAGK